MITVGNAATGIPQEIARKLGNMSSYNWIEFFYLGDFEYSIPTNERQNGNELAVHSADGRLTYSTFRTYSIEMII